MKRALPAYVYDKKGATYFQRRGFPTVRIAAAPGTAEFHAEYARLLAGERPIYAGPRVFSALVTEYIASNKYRGLSPRTGRDYDKVLSWVTAKLGPLPVAGGSDELIMSITGHKTMAMVAKYAGPARQKSRAKEAKEKRK